MSVSPIRIISVTTVAKKEKKVPDLEVYVTDVRTTQPPSRNDDDVT